MAQRDGHFPTALCFAAGSRILAAHGEVAVEALRVGDRVVGLRSGKLMPVRWIGQREVDLRTHPNPGAINPVRIRADAFGPRRPHRDLILSPNHALYIDGHLIAVRYLVNGTTIRQEAWDCISYYHIALETHDVLLAEGLPAESFLDGGSRSAFSNGGAPVMLHPDFVAGTSEVHPCAPDLPRGGPLATLKQMLLDRAIGMGHAMTGDPNLYVLGRQPRHTAKAGSGGCAVLSAERHQPRADRLQGLHPAGNPRRA